MIVEAAPNGSHTTLVCDNPSLLHRLLDRPLSYKVKGYYWDPRYRARQWDGKEHLLRSIEDGRAYVIPTGVEDLVESVLVARGHQVRWTPAPAVGLPIHSTWKGHALRDYQEAAAKAALAAGRGLLKLPTRSGKTLLAAYIIGQIGLKTCFVVSNKLLCEQAARTFEESLDGVAVSRIAEGEWDPSGDIVVATVQSLAERDQTEGFARLCHDTGVVILDEIHHLAEGERWREVALRFLARRKFGLSATFRLKDSGENETSSIWLRALCGPLLYEVTPSDLIERGFLTRPTVRFVRHNAPKMPSAGWSPAVVAEGITSCPERNARICEIACKAAYEGQRVLIDTGRIKHVKILTDILTAALPPRWVFPVIGKTTSADREKILVAFEKGDVRVVVGTVLGEGVDIPSLAVVINAEGGKAEVSTVQRLRNLTLCEGKTTATIYDMIDDHNPYLRKWAIKRFHIYKREPAFILEVERPDGVVLRRRAIRA